MLIEQAFISFPPHNVYSQNDFSAIFEKHRTITIQSKLLKFHGSKGLR